MPGIITVALFSFLASWNEFVAPLIFITDDEKFTLPVALFNLQSGSLGAVDYGTLLSGVVTAAVPCVAAVPAAAAVLRPRLRQGRPERLTGWSWADRARTRPVASVASTATPSSRAEPSTIWPCTAVSCAPVEPAAAPATRRP